jgi:DNA adenine methylase
MMMTNKKRILLPLQYPGSKATVFFRLRETLPCHEHYVSVFGGSGADLISKFRSQSETYNDLNSDLCNFFCVLQNDSQKLLRLIECTPHSRHVFEQCIGLLASNVSDPVQRAWAYCVVSNQATAGHDASIARPTRWGYVKLPSGWPRWSRLPRKLTQVANRFQGVRVLNWHFNDVLTQLDGESVLFYADPPYIPSARRDDRQYKHEMSEADHEELLIRLMQVKGRVMLSGYPCALYEKYLRQWREIEVEKRCIISPLNRKPARRELMWFNYDVNGNRIAS